MKALVVYKKSQYQIYVKEKQNAHIKSLVSAGAKVTQGMLKAHETHERDLEKAIKIIEKHFSSVRTRYRGACDMIKDADIVFTAGGDGTLLAAQKYIPNSIPVVGINTDPERSVGSLLLVKKVDDLDKQITKILKNELWNTRLSRLQVKLNDTVIRTRVLNDVLFAHKHPAAMSSFNMTTSVHFSVKSSGLWVSTATGSTGAIQSAGGQKMHLPSKELQWLIREPYNHGLNPVNEYVATDSNIFLVSKMREAVLSFDGFRDSENIKMGDEIEISTSPEHLLVYI